MGSGEDFFGNADKVALMRRSASLWRLLRDNPRLAYYGRTVALSDPGGDAVEMLRNLAAVRLAVADSDWIYASVIDPAVMAGTSITK